MKHEIKLGGGKGAVKEVCFTELYLQILMFQFLRKTILSLQGKMKNEIAAVVFFFTRLVRKHDKFEKRNWFERFAEKLTLILQEKYKNHWYQKNHQRTSLQVGLDIRVNWTFELNWVKRMIISSSNKCLRPENWWCPVHVFHLFGCIMPAQGWLQLFFLVHFKIQAFCCWVLLPGLERPICRLLGISLVVVVWLLSVFLCVSQVVEDFPDCRGPLKLSLRKGHGKS